MMKFWYVSFHLKKNSNTFQEGNWPYNWHDLQKSQLLTHAQKETQPRNEASSAITKYLLLIRCWSIHFCPPRMPVDQRLGPHCKGKTRMGGHFQPPPQASLIHWLFLSLWNEDSVCCTFDRRADHLAQLKGHSVPRSHRLSPAMDHWKQSPQRMTSAFKQMTLVTEYRKVGDGCWENQLGDYSGK